MKPKKPTTVRFPLRLDKETQGMLADLCVAWKMNPSEVITKLIELERQKEKQEKGEEVKINILPSHRSTLEGQVCPVCKHQMDMVSTVDSSKAMPKTGDISLCYKCGAILLYDRELQLMKPNAYELKVMKGDAEMWARLITYQSAIREGRLHLVDLRKPS